MSAKEVSQKKQVGNTRNQNKLWELIKISKRYPKLELEQQHTGLGKKVWRNKILLTDGNITLRRSEPIHEICNRRG